MAPPSLASSSHKSWRVHFVDCSRTASIRVVRTTLLLAALLVVSSLAPGQGDRAAKIGQPATLPRTAHSSALRRQFSQVPAVA